MLAFVFTLWLTFVLGCSSTGNLGSASDPDHALDYKHGGKITILYDSAKNETTVYHEIHVNDATHKEPPLRPDLTISGQTIKGKHTFEFSDTVAFSGRKPSTIPTNTSLSLLHAITSRKGWHFPPKAKLTIIADGNSFDIPVPYQNELKKDDPSDAEFYEVLITKPTYEMYAKIANAKDVTVQIGTASFKLDTESIASYRDFLVYLTPGSNPSATDATTPSPTQRSTPSTISSMPSSSSESYGVTLAGYSRLKTGMTYAQVVKILGEEGVEISSNDIGGYRTVMYQWKAENGIANMNAMFQNGKLMQKAQFGLE
jgi:hypothetical protein